MISIQLAQYSKLRDARKVFGVLLYKINAFAILSRILSILHSDWLQCTGSVWMNFNWHKFDLFIFILCLFSIEDG